MDYEDEEEDAAVPESFPFPWEGLTPWQAVRTFMRWLIFGSVDRTREGT